jgi:putative membrane protein insertion efficiency factor
MSTTLPVHRPAAPARGVRRAALALIALYQGLRGSKPSPCRYFPTCSAYAAEAIERHGVWYGGRLTARRLARCRPGGSHGVDLVPLERHPVEEATR